MPQIQWLKHIISFCFPSKLICSHSLKFNKTLQISSHFWHSEHNGNHFRCEGNGTGTSISKSFRNRMTELMWTHIVCVCVRRSHVNYYISRIKSMLLMIKKYWPKMGQFALATISIATVNGIGPIDYGFNRNREYKFKINVRAKTRNVKWKSIVYGK